MSLAKSAAAAAESIPARPLLFTLFKLANFQAPTDQWSMRAFRRMAYADVYLDDFEKGSNSTRQWLKDLFENRVNSLQSDSATKKDYKGPTEPLWSQHALRASAFAAVGGALGGTLSTGATALEEENSGMPPLISGAVTGAGLGALIALGIVAYSASKAKAYTIRAAALTLGTIIARGAVAGSVMHLAARSMAQATNQPVWACGAELGAMTGLLLGTLPGIKLSESPAETTATQPLLAAT